MQQNLNEKQDNVFSDILLVFNEKDKKVSAVTGIDENGDLKTVAPTKENEGAFMKVDKGANAFSNFFSNFWRQLKKPSGLDFFKFDERDAVKYAPKLQAAMLADDPGKKIKMVEKYFVMPGGSGRYKETRKEPKQQTTSQTGQKQAEAVPEQKQAEAAPEKSPTFYKREEVNFEPLKHFGITEKMLEDSGQMNNLLNRKLTDHTYYAHGKFDGMLLDCQAAIQLGRDPDTNKVVPMVLGVNKEPDFKRDFFGETFDEKDQKNLIQTGNLGRVAHLADYRTGVVEPHILSLDPLTNRYFARKLSSFDKLESISKAKLTPDIKQQLLEGKAVKIPGMVNQYGKPITCPVQLSGHPNRFIDYLHNQGIKQEVNEKGEKVFRGSQIKGVPITKEQESILNNKGVLYLKDMTGKDGKKFSSYVIWDSKAGRLRFPKNHPYKSTQKDLKEQQPAPRQGTEQAKGKKQNKSIKDETAKEGKKAVRKSVQKVR